ncbi:F0F1 ATP synthase subunit gamma [Dyella sp.]|uniref:F0F1 ATP synthase subunit gamma n=1 Tax=Dyella sp. TaxID=1869338 RepID=UPI002D77992E|nr:F0F1 ATP synthase subunit gamma [Dyella sp.]HET7331102.1 F0F1 ATP synthase subunit gamma [Dyella sp.]
MARWRELARHSRALEEIGTIMSAMRSLAFIEARRLAEGTLRQAQTVDAIRTAIDNLGAHYPAARPSVVPQRDILILIGSERGLCGDFDERVASHPDVSRQSSDGVRIAVGSRLCQLLDERGVTHLPMAGAAVIEDIPGVMSHIATSVQASTQADHDNTNGLIVIHHDDEGNLHAGRVLPATGATRAPCWRNKPQLQLPPPQLYGVLVEHYVFASLNAILLASLLAENRRRLDQMSAALDRLHERIDNLDRRRRRARQEAITEEIEIILLGI